MTKIAGRFKKFYEAVTAQLNQAGGNAFYPNITSLDMFIQSLSITP